MFIWNLRWSPIQYKRLVFSSRTVRCLNYYSLGHWTISCGYNQKLMEHSHRISSDEKMVLKGAKIFTKLLSSFSLSVQ